MVMYSRGVRCAAMRMSRWRFTLFQSALAYLAFIGGAAISDAEPPMSVAKPQGSQLSAVVASLPALPAPKGDDTKESSPVISSTLLRLADDQLKADGVHLYSGFAAISPYSFVIKPSKEGEWNIYLVSSQPADALTSIKLFESPLAVVTRKAMELEFRWNPDNITRYSSQLSNALMEINQGGTTHTISFREPARIAAIPLDLSKPGRRVAIALDPVPDLETLSVRLDSVDGPEPKLSAPSGSVAAPFGEKLLLERGDAIGTQLELKMTCVREAPELRINAYYKNADGKRVAFVGKDVTTERNSKRKLLEEAEESFSAAKAAIPQIEGQLDSERHRVAQDIQEQTEIVIAIKKYQSQLRKAESAVRRYSRSGPQVKESLERLEAVAQEGTALHNNVYLNLSIIAEKDGRQLELLTFGGSNAPSQ
jgi:hypothetical protein